MRRRHPWIYRALLLAATSLIVAFVTRQKVSADGGLLPSIGGDTWPPVPVKDSRRT